MQDEGAEMAGEEHRPSLEDVDARLKQARRTSRLKSSADETRAQHSSNLGQGMRVALELLASLLVGGGLGWFLDDAFGTKPWLFLVFLLLGLAAGFRSVHHIIRTVSRQNGP